MGGRKFDKKKENDKNIKVKHIEEVIQNIKIVKRTDIKAEKEEQKDSINNNKPNKGKYKFEIYQTFYPPDMGRWVLGHERRHYAF